MKKRTYAIACAVLSVDLKHCADKLETDIEYKFLEAGLHSNPELLRNKLQDAIDDISATGLCDRIIIGYGICGKGTIGIHSQQVPLVIPRVHDCIALFLGGDQAYKDEFKKYPGTYYLSAGWCEEKTEPSGRKNQWAYYGDQKLHYHDLVEKHGEKAANQTFDFLNSWQKNYQRAAFIDTGVKKKSSRYEKIACHMAESYNWEYHKIQGSLSLIRKLITTRQSTPEILCVPPEHVTCFDAIGSVLSASPLLKKTGIKTGNPAHLPDDAATSEKNSYARRTDRNTYITYGIGIDAGGTYTDAVIYDLKCKTTLSKSKSLTTKWDFTIGISKALKKLDPQKLCQVELVSLSTTLATNAIVENEGQKVGMILMPPAGLGLESKIKHHPKSVIKGQLDITGKETAGINTDEIIQVAENMIKHHDVTAFAVSGYAGSINPEHEIRVKNLIQKHTGLFVCCGHELSDSLNFQTRAVTAMLNARIIPRLTRLIQDLKKVLINFNIDAPMVVVKGDGTLMSSSLALKRPVETILSGPAASVAGARHLTGIKNALIVDMGGTTTDTASLVDNLVELNEEGSFVGGYRTHVKALNIRTSGLGGDSLINLNNGLFTIGPGRVAPVSWLGTRYPETMDAITYLNSNLLHYKSSTHRMQLVTLTGSEKKISLSPLELQVISILKKRPCSLDELVQKTGALSDSSLPLERLEDHFIIQRCGLTLTDILHVTGKLTKWNTDITEKYTGLFSHLSQLDIPDLTQKLLKMGINRMALELLKHQLDQEVDPKSIDTCPVCSVFIKNLLDESHPHYNFSMNFKRPVIGIGAPVACFLPQAAQKFGTQAILPVDADVANAIGAITSHVMIKKRVKIIPGSQGDYRIEGLSGSVFFKNFDEADRYARDNIKLITREHALEAGTSCSDVVLTVKDQIPRTNTGDSVFMGREITCCLTGHPDIVVTAKTL